MSNTRKITPIKSMAEAKAALSAPAHHKLTADVPSKYKGRTGPDGEQLVGTRIDPGTVLGAELANLRQMWTMAGAERADRIMRETPDQARLIAERSQNIPIPDTARKQWQEQRSKVIRGYVQKVIAEVTAQHGRPPKSISFLPEVIDEVQMYCSDMDVVFLVSKPE